MPKTQGAIGENSSLSRFALEYKETEKLGTSFFVQYGVAYGAQF